MASAANINPKMLTWAREAAGLSVAQAAQKLALRDTSKMTGAEKLQTLEAGGQVVSGSFIQKAAAVYRRPLTTFYLANPPPRGERGEDFRGTSNSASTRENAMLDALVRDITSRQKMLRELVIEEDDAEPLTFVGSLKPSDGVARGVTLMRDILAFPTPDQQKARNPAELFAALKTRAEVAGIYVLLVGDLGSHQTDIDSTVFRGFALADDIAPFVVINDNDAVVARSFTLVHELCHILIRASGISGPVSNLAQSRIERFCNDVAGEFLLPDEALIAAEIDDNIEAALDATRAIASRWRISEGVVAYRLTRLNKVSEQVASALFATFAARWRSQKAQEKAERDPSDDGPSYYVVKRSRLGSPLLSVVRRAVQSDALTYTKAAKILGVNPSSVAPLLQEKPRPRAA